MEDDINKFFENNEAKEKNFQSNNSTFTKNFFSFNGICNLEKYWTHFLISVAIVLVDYGYSFLYKYTPHWLDLIETIICLLCLFVWNIHLICLGVQRFRDTGRNPWKILIPIYGSIIVKFFPSCKNQSNNKYITYSIPAEKWLRILLIIWAFFATGPSTFGDSIQTAITGISRANSGRVVFSNDDITCKKYHTDEGINYYFNIYRYDGYVINTIVFSKEKTLKYLKKQYNEIKKKESDNYLDDFCDFIKELYYDNPAIEFYNDEGESIIFLRPEDYINKSDELIEEYEPSIIRFWYEDFDYVFVEDLIDIKNE